MPRSITVSPASLTMALPEARRNDWDETEGTADISSPSSKSKWRSFIGEWLLVPDGMALEAEGLLLITGCKLMIPGQGKPTPQRSPLRR
ncbi:MAG: hypothetical protein D6816_10765 [Bacteroidetes bacterium]|nr:MAG: hypothetical protein D6816_10765 [Bacteroidota bacterium]